MTTKVLIANFGPDDVLIRLVDYGPHDLGTGIPAKVVTDTVVTRGNSFEGWVHEHQQILIGEKRGQ